MPAFTKFRRGAKAIDNEIGAAKNAVVKPRKEKSETLWAAVIKNRNALRDCENFPILASLEDSWEVLNEFYGGIIRRADEECAAKTPFEALVFHVEMGFYPPPELLLSLLDAYQTYLDAAGKLTLEEVLFERPKRKAGGHAQRYVRRMKMVYMANKIHQLVQRGETKMRAAESVSNDFGGTPDADSIIRMLNKDPFLKGIINGFLDPRK
jgi:hypothetical protein